MAGHGNVAQKTRVPKEEKLRRVEPGSGMQPAPPPGTQPRADPDPDGHGDGPGPDSDEPVDPTESGIEP